MVYRYTTSSSSRWRLRRCLLQPLSAERRGEEVEEQQSRVVVRVKEKDLNRT
jgi:hypothetical protein